MKQKRRWKRFKKSLPLSLMLLPGAIVVFIFGYVPLFGLVLPFKNYKVSQGFFGSSWSGFDNFKYLFNGNLIKTAAINTVVYNLLFIFLGILCSVLLATLLFDLSARSVKVFQTILLLPYFISWVVGSYVVNAFLDMDSGVVNRLLTSLGFEGVLWYNDPSYWPVIIVIVYLWKSVGYNTIIYYAAMMGLDVDCFEAARLDGATWWQRLRYIIIPGIQNMIWIMAIMAVGNIFRGDFGLFYNVPLNSSLLYSKTDVVDTVVYRALLELGDIGMSSAAAFMQSVCGLILIVTVNYIVRKKNPDNALF